MKKKKKPRKANKAELHFRALRRLCNFRIKVYLVQNGRLLAGMKQNHQYKVFADAHNLTLPLTIRAQEEFFIKFFYEDGNAKNYKCYLKKRVPKAKRVRDTFYYSEEWIALKKIVYGFYKPICMKCGVKNTETHVDHIKPRSLHPQLSLDPKNLQILCKDCNLEKLNLNDIDYRPKDSIKPFFEYLEKCGCK